IEEFYNARLRHRENSSPQLLRRRPQARQLGWTFTIGESVGRNRPQSTPPAPTGGGTSLPARNYTPTARLGKEATRLLRVRLGMGPISQATRNPALPWRPSTLPRRVPRAESLFSSVHGGLTTIIPAPLSRFGSFNGPTRISARSALAALAGALFGKGIPGRPL